MTSMISTFLMSALAESWHVLAASAPYLLFGFLAAGVMHGFVSTQVVARHLGGGGVGSVVKAALFGVPLPLCSCGVLPAALDLRKRGASRGAVLSFLISTPETGVDSIALSWVLLGPMLTIFRPLAAFVTAVAAGILENAVGREPTEMAVAPRACGCAPAPSLERLPVRGRLRTGLSYAFGDLLKDLVPWLAIGFLAAGLIGAAVPQGALGQVLGAGPLAYLAMLALGIPLYLCATASTPIAAAFLLKGLSPGAALVFLLAGPATNTASIVALAGALGWRAATRYLATIAVVSVGMGALLDVVAGGAAPVGTIGPAVGELLPTSVETASAVLLTLLALRPFVLWGRSPPKACSTGA